MGFAILDVLRQNFYWVLDAIDGTECIKSDK